MVGRKEEGREGGREGRKEGFTRVESSWQFEKLKGREGGREGGREVPLEVGPSTGLVGITGEKPFLAQDPVTDGNAEVLGWGGREGGREGGRVWREGRYQGGRSWKEGGCIP